MHIPKPIQWVSVAFNRVVSFAILVGALVAWIVWVIPMLAFGADAAMWTVKNFLTWLTELYYWR